MGKGRNMAIRARQVMRKKIRATENTTVREAAHLLISNALPGVPVVNERMEVIGVVTECNVLNAVREGADLDTVTAGRIMMNNFATADAEASCRDLIQMMLSNNYPVIPVVHNKKYVGVVSRHMIMDSTVAPDYTVIPAGETVACA